MSKLIRIGELSAVADCPVETIRYYEREGLLSKPKRTSGNYRLYDRQHIETLQLIRNCRALDMTLEEIRTLLTLRTTPARACTAVNDLLDEHIKHVRDRISELRKLDRTLRSLRAKCRQTLSVENCEILKGIGHLSPAKGTGKHSAHIRARPHSAQAARGGS
jgi:Cd(II)/Pb(II)-responsive transcriptional regulator